MKAFLAYTKKEAFELCRTGRLLLLLLIFLLFGIMNPAIAKLTPWLMDFLAEDLARSGMTIAQVSVDALTSWTQFHKNVPIALILFLVLISGTLTNECQDGTLLLLLTKGLPRRTILIAKAAAGILLWSACYWMCYGITWMYNAFFWDNRIVPNAAASALAIWLIGVWLVCALILMSSFAKSSTTVLAGVALLAGICYLAGLFPPVSEYLPTQLLSAGALINNAATADFTKSAAAAGISSLLMLIAAVRIFDRRAL